MSDAGAPGRVLTIGHSTHPLEEFLALLSAHGVTVVVDVRTVPRSRRHPWFAGEALAASLPAAGFGYRHVAALGGLRKPRKDSVNTAWRNDSFRGYADHLQTPAFEAGLQHVLELAVTETPVLMCAEAVPWRCHRQLIADALVARGVVVEDIYSETQKKPHALTSFAVVDGTRVTYPAAQTTLPLS